MANVLKCNAEFDKIYYVEYQNTLRECKLICTHGLGHKTYYTLNVAGIGVVDFPYNPPFDSNPDWYHTSKTPSILYESINAYKNRQPIIDDYGSTDNAYNSRFICPLFPNYQVCGCGGGIYTWKWDGCKANRFIVTGEIHWKWDEKGFALLNAYNNDGCYPSKLACEVSNKIEVVKF